MLISGDAIMAHVVGDYLLQSDWMASEKTKKSAAALAHAVTYTLPFLLITLNWKALLFVCVTHFFIDRWRLIRYVCWAKNFLSPKYVEIIQTDQPVKLARNLPWAECSATGYPPGKPAWMSVWLMIIADNCAHIILNGVAIKYLV
jgi:hypothetical protein